LRPGFAVRGARAHNLAGLDLDVPAGGLVAITGVSGSGKSSLAFDVIGPSVEAVIEANGRPAAPVGCSALLLAEPFQRVVAVAALAAGASPWGSPASVVGLFDPIRDLFAATAEARARGLKKAHFSTANPGGRCEACEGRGQTRISMDFLPDVWSVCEDCGGRRYGADVLACTVAGRSLADVLNLNADDGRSFVEESGAPARARRILTAGLDALRDAGMGYARLGQPVRTLSGGERQRLVLAGALAGRAGGPALYLMDEPTTGLHVEDVRQLLAVFDRLVAAGHTVIVVEHHLDVIASADWVIDLGPEGGTDGGRIVAEGPPSSIAACAASWTGRALAAPTSLGA
jgi:excinuclease ABC subunit A